MTIEWNEGRMRRPHIVLIGPKDARRSARAMLRGVDVAEFPVWNDLPAGPAVCVDARRLVWLSPGALASLWSQLATGAPLVVPASNIGRWPLCGLEPPRGAATSAELARHAEAIRARGSLESVGPDWPLPAVFAVADASLVTSCPRTVGDLAPSAPVVESVWCHHRAVPLVSGAMIVKNEAHQIEAAISSLEGFVDEVVVYDTGSTDDTVAIARRLGASVRLGYWDDDFARARNEVCAMVRGDWFLAHDADDRLVATATARAELRKLLPTIDPRTAISLATQHLVDATTGEMTADMWCKRLLPRQMRWRHRVHEVAVQADGSPPIDLQVNGFPVLHVGYASGMDERHERNLRLAELRRDECPPDQRHLAEFEVARTLASMGRVHDAVMAFGAVIDLANASPEAICSRMFAASLLGQLGLIEMAEELIDPVLDHTTPEVRDAARYTASRLTDDPNRVAALLDGIGEVNWMYIRATAQEVEARRQCHTLPVV